MSLYRSLLECGESSNSQQEVKIRALMKHNNRKKECCKRCEMDMTINCSYYETHVSRNVKLPKINGTVSFPPELKMNGKFDLCGMSFYKDSTVLSLVPKIRILNGFAALGIYYCPYN